MIFDGKSALVIGGSGGIGAELSVLLAENGADVTIHGRSSEKINAVSDIILNKTGRRAGAVIYDFSSCDFCSMETSALKECAESADIICVCYGPFLQKSLHDMTCEDWYKTSLLNYSLPGFFVSTALNGMMGRRWGRILLFGGTGTSFRSEFRTNAAYAGAKTAVGTLVRSTAAVYAEYGITCNAVLPGFTRTEYVSEEQASVLSEKMPLGTMLSVQSIAGAGLFLLSNPDFNGVLLPVDRGWMPYS